MKFHKAIGNAIFCLFVATETSWHFGLTLFVLLILMLYSDAELDKAWDAIFKPVKFKSGDIVRFKHNPKTTFKIISKRNRNSFGHMLYVVEPITNDGYTELPKIISETGLEKAK